LIRPAGMADEEGWSRAVRKGQMLGIFRQVQNLSRFPFRDRKTVGFLKDF
jgi:hypothetical protein